MQKTPVPIRDESLPALPPILLCSHLYPRYRAEPVMIRHLPLQGGTACLATDSHHPSAL